MGGRGRPVTRSTRLGRTIVARDMKVYDLCGKTGIYNRLMTEYIQGRRVILPEHVEALCKVLSCTPEDIVEPNLKENLTEVTGRVLKDPSLSVKDLDMSHLEPYEPMRQPVIPKTAHTPNVAPDSMVRRAG